MTTKQPETPPTKSRMAAYLETLPDHKRDRLTAAAAAVKDSTAAPSLKLEMEGDNVKVSYDCESDNAAYLLQMAEIGTTDSDFYGGLICQMVGLGSQGRKVDADNSNFVLSVVRAVEPRDGLEALLATQMGAIHSATMMMARRLNLVETIAQQDAAERALNKLARTFATQMEALKRYRTGGQQKVTVEHVTVNAGGQAIVGAVEAGGGGRK